MLSYGFVCGCGISWPYSLAKRILYSNVTHSLFRLVYIIDSFILAQSKKRRKYSNVLRMQIVHVSSASDLGLHCLPMSHKKDAWLINMG